MITFADLTPREQELFRAGQQSAPAPASAPAPQFQQPPQPGFGSPVVSGPWGAGPVAPPPQAFTGFAAPAASGGIHAPLGISLKLTLQLPDGSALPFDLNLGPECANPQALQMIVATMLQAGWPIKVYPPRNQFGGGGRFGGGGGGFGGGRFGGGNRWGGRGGY